MLERFKPVPRDSSDAIRHQFFDHDSVIYRIESFLDLKISLNSVFLWSIFSYQESVLQIRDVTVDYSFWNADSFLVITLFALRNS